MNFPPLAVAEADFAEAAIVAIGSNLPGRFGSPGQMARRAMAALQRLSESPPLCSSLYCSKPVDCPPGAPDFINAVAALWPPPEMSPEALLAELLEIEAVFGRLRGAAANAPGALSVKGEPRTLDLDLVCWGGRAAATERLCLPHPRFAGREFVLAPLAELAPHWVPPGQSQTVTVLLAALPGRKDVRRV